MSKARIGFIGLGLMGGAMVGRLQDLGYALTVLGNKDRSQLDIAITRGAQEAQHREGCGRGQRYRHVVHGNI